MDEQEPERQQLVKLLEEISKTMKSIDKSLKTIAGSVDEANGGLPIKGDITATCFREY